jgi:REP element-mobilizing transposase RayT/DNA-binding CsgD family transcriptional regulator
MPRKTRITEPGYYHIINRGVERRNIFLMEEDYNKFLSLLQESFKTYQITLHTYCLMTNHYHLLIETKYPNISEAMKKINSYYSIYFNKKYNRSGHLWQGRFASYYLYDDVHFWYVAKYIERNPINANMVKSIEHYKYQSFFQWKYKLKHFELIKDSKVFELTLKEYEEFIRSDIQKDILEKIYITPKYIKQNGEMKILYKRLETFFEEDININRNENILKAYHYGYTKAEIAEFLKLSPSTVLRIVMH